LRLRDTFCRNVELVAVDGFTESPEEWTFACSNDEMEEVEI